MSAILGLNKHKTALDVWAEKTGRKPDDDLSDNEAVLFGNLLEDTIAQEWARRNSKKVRRVNRTLYHPQYDFIMGHIDRDVVGEQAGLEIKNMGEWVAKSALGDGEDEAKPEHIVQCLWYAMLWNVPHWYLAVLVGGNRLRQFTIKRDPELEKTILERAVSFWQNNVLADVPPPAVDYEDAKGHLPMDVTVSDVEADQELSALIDQAVDLKRKEDAHGKAFKAIQGQIAMKLSDNTDVKRNGSTILTWRTQKSSRISQEKLAEMLSADQLAAARTESVTRVMRFK